MREWGLGRVGGFLADRGFHQNDAVHLAVRRGIRATLVAPPIGGAVRVGTRAHLVVGVVVHAVAPAIRLAIVVIIPFVAVVAPAVVGCEMRAVRVGVRASPVTGLWRGVVPWRVEGGGR